MVTEAQVKAFLPKSGFLRDYVLWAEHGTDSHLIYHVGCALSLLSMVVPTDYSLPIVGEAHANTFILLLGKSTEARKTTAIKLAMRVFKDAIQIPKAAAVQPGSREHLIDALIARPQMILFYPEFGSFLAASEHGQLNSVRAAMAEAYDGTRIGRGTVSKKGLAEEVENPRLSVLGGVTPGFLEKHTTESDWMDGWLARFAVLLGERERYTKRPPFDEAGCRRLVAKLRSYMTGSDLFDGKRPAACRADAPFTPEAGALWDAWVEPAQSRGGHSRIRASIARAPDFALKVALLLAWDFGGARSGKPWSIGAEEVAFATRLSDIHIESAISLGEGITGSKDMRDRRRVLSAVQKLAQVNGAVYPVTPGLIYKEAELLSRQAEECLRTLVAEGTLARVPDMLGKVGYIVVDLESAPAPAPALAPPAGVNPFDW